MQEKMSVAKWTERCVRKPPVVSKFQPVEFDAKQLKIRIKGIRLTYQDTEQLERGAALLSRLIARRASSFRMQYIFRYMRQTNVALCRWKELSILDTVEDILGGFEMHKGKYNIPTNASFEYFLIRLQCAAKILARIIYCAREAFIACTPFLAKAFYVETVTLYLAVLAKIWRICAEYCKKTVAYYNDLIVTLKPHLMKPNKDSPARTFPDRLDDLLGEEWMQINVKTLIFHSRKSLRKKDNQLAIDISTFDNSDHEEEKQKDMISAVVAMTDNTIGSKKQGPQVFLKIEDVKFETEMAQPSNAATVTTGKAVKRPLPSTSVDLGEAICRDTLESKVPKVETSVEPEVFPTMSTLEDVHRFITREDVLRKGSQHQLSRRLNNDQWKRFKLRINEVIGSTEPRRAVRAFQAFSPLEEIDKVAINSSTMLKFE